MEKWFILLLLIAIFAALVYLFIKLVKLIIKITKNTISTMLDIRYKITLAKIERRQKRASRQYKKLLRKREKVRKTQTASLYASPYSSDIYSLYHTSSSYYPQDVFTSKISEEKFKEIVEKAVARIKKRTIKYSIEGAKILGEVESLSRISTWSFTLDFYNYGRLTGDCTIWSENDTSEIPNAIANSIKQDIQAVLNG